MTDNTGGKSIDMSQFHRVFFEEAAEHLANLENLLVTIDVASPSDEDLNAIFRAAHSIKGGSGTFGFKEMTDVTHALETMLDRVRKHEMGLRTDMVDVLLEARDLLLEQLAIYQEEGTPPAAPVAAMCERIRACMAGSPPPQPSEAANPASKAVREIEIAFATPADAHSSLPGLAEELAELGKLTVVEPSEGEAVRRFRLATSAGDEEIRNRFAFIVDPATVTITTAAAAAAPAAAAAADEGFGFFDDAPGVPKAAEPDAGFGFFDEAPGAPKAATPDPGYGFFEPLPDRPAAQAPLADQQRRFVDSRLPGAQVGPPPGVNERRQPDRRSGAGDTSIRVGIEKVDAMINLVGELVITQAMLAQTAAGIDPAAYERLAAGLSQLDRNTRDLQEAVMSVRMMPIAMVFNRFPRVVRDLAGKLGKQVELKMEGETTELDKGLIEKIADPLTHLVRNSLDHGVETPERRIAAGKTPEGTVTLRASHRGGNIVIEVADDGAGLSRERILAKAKERGMPVSDDMPDSEVWLLIFEAGLSTAAVVTDVSGRGVGMDVVRRNIRELGGKIDIASSYGHGTRITIRLPLTLAILDGMSVGVSGQTFILPLNHVVESLQVKPGDIKGITGQGRVLPVRGAYVPVMVLRDMFGLPPAPEAGDGVIVILESDGETIAMLVDELLGQHQVVIKSLESNYKRVPGISGATIMGDGHVAMIIDVPGMVSLSHR